MPTLPSSWEGLTISGKVIPSLRTRLVGDPENLVSRCGDSMGRQDFLHAGFVQRGSECERTGTGVRDFHKLIQSGDIHFLQRFVLDALDEIEDQIGLFIAEIVDEACDIAIDVDNRGFVPQRVEGLFNILHFLHHAHFGEIHMGRQFCDFSVSRIRALTGHDRGAFLQLAGFGDIFADSAPPATGSL